VKINEIFGGASLSGIGKNLYKAVAGDANYQADKKFIKALKTKLAPQVAAVQNPATPVATQAGPSTAGAVLKNMSIAETDPLVIAYGKKLFHLNSTGDWAYLGSDAPIKDQTTAALLTKFADSQGV